MHFDGGAVQCHAFNPNPQDLLLLQASENSVQHPRFAPFAPAVHPRVNGMPVAQTFGQTAPFASHFGNMQQGVEQLKIDHAHIATLTRQTPGNALILPLGDFHYLILTTPARKTVSVNTPWCCGTPRKIMVVITVPTAGKTQLGWSIGD